VKNHTVDEIELHADHIREWIRLWTDHTQSA